jgi:hypothetical protein
MLYFIGLIVAAFLVSLLREVVFAEYESWKGYVEDE